MPLVLRVTLKSTDFSKASSNFKNIVHELFHVLFKAWLIAWPLAFPGGLVVIKCWRGGGSLDLIARTCVWLGRIREYFRPRYNTYRTIAEEEEYWKASERTRRAYRASDANTTPAGAPLVRYYVPKLPPTYRERVEVGSEAREYQLSPRIFCKWHRMVFRGPMHPTLQEAAKHIRYYSNRDRREIYRISRFLTDEEVFCRKWRWTMRYAVMWRRWLGTKGPDVAVVFE
ncbi:hypothetical protein BV20DRAFT_1038499 [Pilatotrama ljubarskyi]|nr:hypothetical protein BV20DRAFT_1038499 [Pilatotrama ljubarskyi]